MACTDVISRQPCVAGTTIGGIEVAETSVTGPVVEATGLGSGAHGTSLETRSPARDGSGSKFRGFPDEAYPVRQKSGSNNSDSMIRL